MLQYSKRLLTGTVLAMPPLASPVLAQTAGGRVQGSSIPEIRGSYLDDARVISWFTSAYKIIGDKIRQSIKDANEPDPTTSNLLQGVEDGIDKYQWQMRAFVQATPTDRNTGWDLNDNKPIDLPSNTPAGQPPAGQNGTQPNQRK